MLTAENKATISYSSHSNRKVFLAIKKDYWRHNIATELENFLACFTAEINSDFTEGIFLLTC